MSRRTELTDAEKRALAEAVQQEKERRGLTQQQIAARVSEVAGEKRDQTSIGRILRMESYGEKFAREVCEALGMDFEATVGRQPPTVRGRLLAYRAKDDPRVLEAIEAYTRTKKRRPADWVIQMANMHAEHEKRTDQTYWNKYVEDIAWMFADTTKRLVP